MGHVGWTQEALRWLREIRNHIARDNPEAARRTAAGIVDRVEILSTFPQIGQRYEGVTDREVRILLYGHYRIAYRRAGALIAASSWAGWALSQGSVKLAWPRSFRRIRLASFSLSRLESVASAP